MLDLFGQANAGTTIPQGMSSANDTVDGQPPGSQRYLIPWLLVQDGPPGIEKGVYHGW